jgi:hypothetical protein
LDDWLGNFLLLFLGVTRALVGADEVDDRVS